MHRLAPWATRAGALPRAALLPFTLLLALTIATRQVQAGTTGKIAGQILDDKQAPVLYAAISVIGQQLGALTDMQGNFTVLNVPPGTYSVTITRLGFKTLTIQNVAVSADNTTRLDAVMTESAVAMEEVVVTASRPPVDVNLTSSVETVSSEQIEQLPVQELQDVVNLQAGVVDGHFRGGRVGEVQYQVDGVSVNNSYDNKTSVRVDRSLLQEVQVISGTFDAEYGQAMSGVVNAVLKTGTDKFEWNGEAFSGAYVYPGNTTQRLSDDGYQPGAALNFQASGSGPTGIPHTNFLASLHRYETDDWIMGERRFVPTDSSNFETKEFNGTGDGEQAPLGFAREWSGVAKLTNTSLKNAKLNYQALFDQVEGRRSDYAFRFNPDGLRTQSAWSICHGLDWTQTLSASTYFDVSLRQNYFHYQDFVYADVYDTRYDAAGPLKNDSGYENGAWVQGVDFGRFEQKTNNFLFKGSLLSQITHEQQIKVGGELQLPQVTFGSPGYLVYATQAGQRTLVRYIDRPPDYPAPDTYYPVITAAFAQEQAELKDLTLRAGLRLEYFNARALVPGDLANPANSISGIEPTPPKSTTPKTALAPRLGVAYPITDRAALHLAYGHFYQFPPIGQIFTNSDYAILSDLQAGGISYGVMGNPDVRPEKTVQYELGYKQALSDDVGLEVTGFYKDIRDLLGVEFIETYNVAEYARLTNVDFGDVIGFTIAADDRHLGPASLSVDYTWQLAQGNSSDPRETATRAEAGEDPRPRLVPFNWDQRHTFNFTATVGRPENYLVSGILRIGSGQPYTPVIAAGFGHGLDDNSARKPAGVVLDLRAERGMQMKSMRMSLFARVFNAFDTRYYNGMVFESTGSPYYSRFPEADAAALEDPSRFYAPRRVEIGVSLGSLQ